MTTPWLLPEMTCEPGAVALDHGIGGVLDQDSFGGVAQVEAPVMSVPIRLPSITIITGSGPRNEDTPKVARDHIAGTDRVLRRVVGHAEGKIALLGVAAGGQSDQVVEDRVADRGGTRDQDTGAAFEEIVLPQVELGPPITLPAELLIRTPSPPFPGSPEPRMNPPPGPIPITLAPITVSVAPGPTTSTPSPPFPEITLPAVSPEPPMMLLGPSMRTPSAPLPTCQ